MSDSTQTLSETPAPATLLISELATLQTFVAGCPHAQTLCAHSTALAAEVVIGLRCNQWSCRACAETKIRTLAAKTREAHPNRLLTLTVDPKLWKTPREAFDATRLKIPDFFRKLRKRFGEIEYLRCTELTKSGWPHYHFLVRSAYLPHAVLKNEWEALTGATIVDIRPVKACFAAYSYLVKYLAKLHKIEWTERHVSYSQNFFPKESTYEKRSLELVGSYTLNETPVHYLLTKCEGLEIRRVTPTVFELLTTHTDPESF